MTDPRYTKLAKLLIGYSTELKKGEKILLDDWVDQESLKGTDGFTVSSFLDFIDRSLAS